MGTCCYTPKKTEFLWWYWLLLFSVIGIPLLLVGLYISRHREENHFERIRKKSLFMFIGCCLLSFALALGFAILCWKGGYFVYQLWNYVFTLCAVAAISEATNKKKTREKRLGRFLGGLAIWYLLCAVGSLFLSLGHFRLYTSSGSVSTFVMEFACAMLPVHFWERFTKKPERSYAIHFLIALLVGSFLYWLTVRYGNVANLYFYHLLRFNLPDHYHVVRHLRGGYSG